MSIPQLRDVAEAARVLGHLTLEVPTEDVLALFGLVANLEDALTLAKGARPQPEPTRFSPAAHQWLSNYRGSIDAALLMAFDAGLQCGEALTGKDSES